MQIDRRRLLADLRELATFGKYETGVDRIALSPEDIAARRWLAGKLDAAGLEPAIDEVGNVVGRMRDAKRALLIGSHTDTVPKGGWLDGALGVIYGLEVARCVKEQGGIGDAGVDVVSFQDEEGTFSAFLGSRTFCGEDALGEAANARSLGGRRLADALAECGLTKNKPSRADMSRHFAYLEAHIEQGPRLEASGNRVGVVTAIVGIRSFRIKFTGRADHAGTTPMALRSDAGAAAMSFGATIADRFAGLAGPDTVWNIGGCALRPGANNVVPAEADMTFQFRDTALDKMETLEAIVYEETAAAAARARASVEVTRVLATLPTPMDARLQAIIEGAADKLGVRHERMPSGAGHDAVVMARYMPSAMLFVPSIGGRSHHISENTSDDDIVTGCEVMLAAVESRLRDNA